MKTNNLSRIIMILMLVLMGSVQAVAQGLKIKKFSYAKSGDLLQGEQLYVRTSSEVTWERGHGYAPAPWIIYVENGGSVDFKLPNFEQFGEFSDYGSNKGTSLSGDVLSGLKPDFYSFSYYLQDENEKKKEKRERFIDVMVVPYAVPYLGKLRLQGSISNDSVHLEKTVSEEDFFTYTIKSDSSLMQFIKINPQGGYDIDGNLGIHAALTQRFPESGYKYAIRLPSEQERLFADGVSVKSLKDMAVLQGLNPNDFVLQIGIDNAEGASIFSEVYRDQARLTKKTTFLRIIDKRPQIKKVKLTTQISPVGVGSVLINGKAQTSITVDQGTEVILEAQASEGYVFSHWKNSEGTQVGTTAKLNYKVSKDETLIAVFDQNAPAKATLKVGVSADGSGTVSINGKAQTSITVDQGTEVILEAQASEGYVFSHWKNSEGTQVGTTAKLNYKVSKDETLIAVFDQNAPGVDEVKVLTGQRDAILTWNAGSATSWQIKLYRSDTKLVKTILTQLPRVELESLVPGEVYRYELVAKRQGKLDSQVKQGTFKTDQFNEREALAPYLKSFSKLLRGKAFDLIWMDVNLSEFDQETPIYEYYWQLNETSPKVLLIPDGKQLTLDTNQVGGCLIILIKSGDTLLYEVRYELDK